MYCELPDGIVQETRQWLNFLLDEVNINVLKQDSFHLKPFFRKDYKVLTSKNKSYIYMQVSSYVTYLYM